MNTIHDQLGGIQVSELEQSLHQALIKLYGIDHQIIYAPMNL